MDPKDVTEIIEDDDDDDDEETADPPPKEEDNNNDNNNNNSNNNYYLVFVSNFPAFCSCIEKLRFSVVSPLLSSTFFLVLLKFTTYQYVCRYVLL